MNYVHLSYDQQNCNRRCKYAKGFDNLQNLNNENAITYKLENMFL